MNKQRDTLIMALTGVLTVYLSFTYIGGSVAPGSWAAPLPFAAFGTALAAASIGALIMLLIYRSNKTHRRLAASWKAEYWLNGCLILDTETTGLGSDAEIVEISIINEQGHLVFNSLVKPTQPIPQEASAVHGITDEWVKHAPSWADISSTVFQILHTHRTLIAYNAAYDLRLIQQTSAVHGITAPQLHIECAMLAAAEYIGEWDKKRCGYKWQKLTNAAAMLGIKSTAPAHRATADCQTTQELISCMADQIAPQPQRAAA